MDRLNVWFARFDRVFTTTPPGCSRGELSKTAVRGLNGGGECGGVGGSDDKGKDKGKPDTLSRQSSGGEERRREGGVVQPPSPSSSSSSATLSAGVAVLPPSSNMFLPRDLKRFACGLCSASRARDAVLSADVPRRLIWRNSLRTSRK